MMPDTKPARTPGRRTWKQWLKVHYTRIKTLQGDPHFIAMGMASGVFVAVTPTIPFHTALSLAFAFLLKGSKPAAIIGSWFCNPLTIGPIYFGSYHLGMLLLGHEITINQEITPFQNLLAMGNDVAIAMVVGGALLGIIPAVIAYFLTFTMFRKLRARHKRNAAIEAGGHHDASGTGHPGPGADTENTEKP